LSLNPTQAEATRYISGPLLVLAGAGSGKTRVITEKIAYLIKQCDYHPRHIAAVTFTNKAAREMKERVSQLLKGSESKGLRVSTFHTLGLDIIRNELKALDYKSGFSIFDAQDSASLMRELLRRDGESDDLIKEMQWRISSWKSAFITPDQAIEASDHDGALMAAMLYASYNRHLKAYNAVDFDDLIMLPVLLFQREPEILDKWRNRIRYLLVDEYQDTNSTQYQLVKQLMGERGALTVVGDDDQSIYAWRGAQPENLALLQDDFPTLKVVKLEQNYRSMGIILKAANTLIDQNPHLFAKKLWSEKGLGDPIRIVTAADDEDEALKVVSRIIQRHHHDNTTFDKFAILYRGNHQSRPFEKALREHRIPYVISGGTSFFSYAEVKDIMAYLRLVSNPDDDAAFLRVVNTPRREIGAVTLEKLGNYAGERGISLFTASFEIGLKSTLNERSFQRLSRFCEWLVDMGDRSRRGDPVEVVRSLLKEIDYQSWLNDTSRDLKAAERKMENVNDLVAWLKRMAEDWDEGEASLAELINRLCLFDILERQNEQESHDSVRLMTLHASKGLEFPHVFLTGVEEELLPHRASIEEDNIEEERRLAYVGITRAQETLTITHAARRRRAGELIRCQTSRFLDELPQEDLIWEHKRDAIPPEERQAAGKAHLANLRSMLGS
jgi:ATP-dependent DNA helicase Rep